MNPKFDRFDCSTSLYIDAVFLWLFLESYEMKIEKKRWTTAVRSTQDLPGALAKTCCRGGSAPRYETSGTVYSAASPLRANMRIPGRPCPIVLSPSFSLSFSHRQPGFRFRFRTGSHVKSIKIIFTRSAARIHDDEISILNQFRSKNEKIADLRISGEKFLIEEEKIQEIFGNDEIKISEE